jgi:sigma-B regulation protein RsbU (phosphoserine phosphatase)
MERTLEGLRRLILVVEDDPRDRQHLTGMLTAWGYSTLTATTGREALALLSAERPAVVILDLTLPDMDGFEVFERIRKSPESADTVVILTHPQPTDEMVFRAFGLHSDCFMRKPVVPEELRAWIERCLSQVG